MLIFMPVAVVVIVAVTLMVVMPMIPTPAIAAVTIATVRAVLVMRVPVLALSRVPLCRRIALSTNKLCWRAVIPSEIVCVGTGRSQCEDGRTT
jgi:hypothetical protein